MNFLIYPVRHLSSAMLPDMESKSFVMVTPLVKTPDRGDVVLLNKKYKSDSSLGKKIIRQVCLFFTANQIDLERDSSYPCTNNQLRRVIALPGDTIKMKDHILYVKPKNQAHFLTEFEMGQKYNVLFYIPPSEWESSIGVQGSFDEFTLKDGEYFVLSDNRKAFEDSRLWGPVKQEEICAKALFCYFPFNKFKFY